MTQFKAPINPVAKRDEKAYKETTLARYFHDLEGEPDFAFTMALQSFDHLEKTSETQEQLFHYLIEDCIFTSLYATFFEELLVVIRENPEYAMPLIDKFSQQSEERERIIAEQAHNHMMFIQNKGICKGCSCCENHEDVSELIRYYQRRDLGFFLNLYVGMQTIHFTMEHLLYDVLPSNPIVSDELSRNNILALRQYIIDYVEARI